MAHAHKVAIIMDGNRRWAKKNNLPASSGHRKGIETLIEIVKSAKQNKVKNLIVYAFSTENWSRESFEVNALMNLINFGVDVKLDEILENEVKLEFIGDLKALPKNAQQGVDKCIEATKHFDGFTLTVALNYGGISDILNAFEELQKDGLELNEENFLARTQLGNNDLDIFIRTGGDMRLSNFLLPNIGYSELFFTNKLWPEFTANDFEDVLKDFDERNRRFGK
ncbi:MAG: polyprenyl diphosphate synthase [Gammaproteobacteria bacterium]